MGQSQADPVQEMNEGFVTTAIDRWRKQQLYINITRTKEEYFLTDSMFKEIGEADMLKPNPRYRKAAPMKLYLKERLETWVAANSDRVEKAMLRRIKLSGAMKQVHEKKRIELLSKIEKWAPEFYIQQVTNELRREAIWYYSNRFDDFNGELTDNGLIHYIRHQHTNYEEFLSKISEYKGLTGVSLIYPLIKLKINAMIEEEFGLKLYYREIEF